MKVLVILWLLSISINGSSAEVSLDELKKAARENHFGLKSKESEVAAIKSHLETLNSSFYPRFGLQAGSEWSKSKNVNELENTVSVYGELNLLNGFNDIRKREKAKIMKGVSENDLAFSKLDLDLLIDKKYYELLFVNKKLKVNLNEMSRVKTHRLLVKKRLKSKLITRADYLEFQLHEKKLQSLNNYLKLEYDQLLSEILTISGFDESKLTTIGGELPHLHLKTKLNDLLRESIKAPLVKQFELKKNIARLNRRNSNSSWIPVIDIRAEYGRLDEPIAGIEHSENSSRVTLAAKWELFSGLATKKKKKLAKFKESMAHFSTKQAEQDFKILVNRNFKILKMLEQTIDFEEENERLANRLYQSTLKEYRKGVKDSGALNSSSEALTNAQNRIFELKSNYIKTKIELEKHVGKSLDFETLEHKRKM